MNISKIESNQQSFTARTKEGNHYDKTNAGKAVGGFFAATTTLRQMSRILKTDSTEFATKIATNKFTRLNKTKSNINKEIFMNHNIEKITKSIKQTKAVSIVMSAIVTAGLYLGTGALIDKIINNHEAKKADKAAE